MEHTHIEPNIITCPCCGETFTEAQKRDLRAQLNVEVVVEEKIVERVREKTRQEKAAEQQAFKDAVAEQARQEVEAAKAEAEAANQVASASEASKQQALAEKVAAEQRAVKAEKEKDLARKKAETLTSTLAANSDPAHPQRTGQEGETVSIELLRSHLPEWDFKSIGQDGTKRSDIAARRTTPKGNEAFAIFEIKWGHQSFSSAWTKATADRRDNAGAHLAIICATAKPGLGVRKKIETEGTRGVRITDPINLVSDAGTWLEDLVVKIDNKSDMRANTEAEREAIMFINDGRLQNATGEMEYSARKGAACLRDEAEKNEKMAKSLNTRAKTLRTAADNMEEASKKSIQKITDGLSGACRNVDEPDGADPFSILTKRANRPEKLSIAIDYLNHRFGPRTVTFGM